MRATNGPATRRRRKKILKRASGYFGGKHRLFKTAKEQVQHSGQYAFNGRKQLKGNFRSLWIIRMNNACRLNGITYGRFIYMLKVLKIGLNRKMLSEIALQYSKLFSKFVQIVIKEYENKSTKKIKN